MRKLIITVSILLTASNAFAQLKPNDRLAIIGDSITEQRQYSVFIEDYLLACKPEADVSAMQFGWSGEQVPQFVARMDNDCLTFKPTLATTCYGMNDGHYAAMTDATGKVYRDRTEAMLDTFGKANVRVILGSPGCVDSKTFKNDKLKPASKYNETLAALRDIDKEIAAARNIPFADVYQPMHDVMEKAKAKYGDDYSIAGNDGVHPAANGHLVMAYAYLKAMGINGDVGTITVDLAGSKATATDGHKVQSFEGDTLMLESSKYPFCFPGDPHLTEHLEKPENARGVLPFLPFNADLNRFMLIVTGASSQSLKITWGSDTKTFTADQLAKGINLADEFLDNPLCAQFAKMDAAVRQKQLFETAMVKGPIHVTGEQLPSEHLLVGELVDATAKRDRELAKAATDAVIPVTHMIRIQPVQ